MSSSSPNDPAASDARAASMRVAHELLWSGLPDVDRGPRRTLSLSRIVEAAIALADQGGIDGLSMRAIASQLGVGTMTLYRYVPDKATLLDLVLDRMVVPADVWSDAELPGEGPTWRRALALAGYEGRTMYLTHPWLLQINWSRPAFGPNTIDSLERVMARLGGLNVTDRMRVNLVNAVDGFVTGSVRSQLLYERISRETGLSNEDYWALQEPVLIGAMETGNYPTLAQTDEDSFDGSWDEVFDLGLTALLDGIAARFDPNRERTP